MCLRDRPRSLGPGPTRAHTLVEISTDSRRTFFSAAPRIVSARVPPYMSAVSNVVMPASRAAPAISYAAPSVLLIQLP
jgi:hypothetical protein